MAQEIAALTPAEYVNVFFQSLKPPHRASRVSRPAPKSDATRDMQNEKNAI
jgi:hypothetical protein